MDGNLIGHLGARHCRVQPDLVHIIGPFVHSVGQQQFGHLLDASPDRGECDDGHDQWQPL